MSVRILRTQPYRRRLLTAHHQVDVILRAQAVGHSAQEAVSIRREVDTRQLGLQVEHGADERRVLMRETIVLLPCPCRSLDVVQRADVLPPGRLMRLVIKTTSVHVITQSSVQGRTILTNLLYCTIMVWMIPRNASYDGKRAVRPVRV